MSLYEFLRALVYLAGFYLGLAVVFGLIEKKFGAQKDQPFFRKGFGLDLIYWFMTPLLSRSAFKYLLGFFLLALFSQDRVAVTEFLDNSASLVSGLPLALQIFLMLFVGDFIAYWSHRAFHCGWLWRIHAVHHSSEEIDWLSSVRMHPVNQGVMFLVQVFALLALGFNLKLLAAYLPIITLHALLTHANVPWSFGPLRYVISSPLFHRWHHTVQEEGRDKNFALMFPVFDLLFGTFYMPQGRQPEKFGASTPVPKGFFAQIAYPFYRPLWKEDPTQKQE